MTYVAWFVCIAARCGLIGRLAIDRIAFEYRWLVLYQAGAVLRSITLAQFDYRSKQYLVAWLISEPVLWALEAAAAFEIYRKVCGAYPGIEKISRWLLTVMAGLSCGLALLPLIVEHEHLMAPTTLIGIKALVFVGKRFFATAIALFALFLTAFWLAHPTSQMKWNVKVYAGFASLNFAVDAVQYLTAITHGAAMGRFFLPLTVFLTVLWAGMMRRSGEYRPELKPNPELKAYADRLSEEMLRALENFRP